MSLPVERLSYSSINTWLMCPRYWYYRYALKLDSPPNPSMILGSAIHDTLETVVSQRARRQEADVLTTWDRSWAVRLEKEPGIVWNAEDTPESTYNEGVRLLKAEAVDELMTELHCDLNESGEPEVERFVEIQVPGVPVPVVGFIDLLMGGVPCDFKVTGKAWTDRQAQGSLQPLFYLAALDQLGRSDHGYRFKHIVFVRTKVPKVQVIESQFRPMDVLWLMDFIPQVWKAIEHEVFPPNPGGWKCDPRYCEHWDRCRW